jgi:hypothetical protein
LFFRCASGAFRKMCTPSCPRRRKGSPIIEKQRKRPPHARM